MTSSQNTTGLFKVVRASAGSGKTYSLVKEFLLLALKTKSADYYKHILAITFTNAAAAEMKERVIHRLQELAENNDTKNSLLNELVQKLNISPEEVQARSAATYKHILHNYSQLSIQTIDGFTHKLIRAFARELKLNQDFSVEMDLDAFIEVLVDKCLDNLGREDEITRYLELFALENLEEGSTWNIRNQLVSFAKHLLKEEAHNALEKLEHLKLADFRKIKQKLYANKKKFENELKQLGNIGLQILQQHGLDIDDFSYGKSGGMAILRKLNNEIFDSPSDRFYTIVEGNAWYGKKTSSEKIEAIERIRPQLHDILSRIAERFTPEKYGAYLLQDLILKNVYTLGLLSKLNEFSNQLKEENNMLLISDFHKLVNEVVIESPAPFIYERIGNRYKHILIDEFQDTSALQWANAVPLIQNALGEGNMSLLVGDAKQSIYRWRGGRVEQFVDLPKVEIKTNFVESNLFFESHFAEEILPQNYRSAKNIVDFNNRLYGFLSPALSSKEVVYHNQAQNAIRDNEGYVQIDFVEESKAEERWTQTSELILQYVNQSMADGYHAGDIAVLTRKGDKEGGKVAALLAENGFEVVTQGSFLLNNSPKVRAVMAYLSYLDNPKKHFAAVEFVKSMNEIDKNVSLIDFVQNHIHGKGKTIRIFLEEYLLVRFPKNEDVTTSVYSNAISIIERFGLKADIYLESLLDHIRDRTIARNMTLTAFIEWWNDSKETTYITSSAGENAIRIMTIHKSKGLQFPVVIYPRFSSKDRLNEIWIETDEATTGLTTALVTARQATVEENAKVIWPKEFYEETEKQRLDDMNLCYVATTRAEDRLYIIAEKGHGNTWLSGQIQRVLENSFVENKIENTWTFGEREPHAENKKLKNVTSISPDFTQRNRLKLRVTNLRDDFSEELLKGNLIHETLAEIKNASVFDKTISNISVLKNLDDTEKKQLVNDISKILNHPQFKKWFSDDVEVLSEREICTSKGKIIRPDRVVIFKDKVEVIDFKTGLPHRKHEAQVKEYVSELKLIYNIPVIGYLLYTNNMEVIEIISD